MTDEEKDAIRRYCGYFLQGDAGQGVRAWGYYQAEGLLVFRLTRLSTAEEAVALRYVATLKTLESNRSEAAAPDLQERATLFTDWRRRLCSFLGVLPGPAIAGGRS